MKYSQALARLIALFSMAWFTLWACAPMMSAPPSPPIPSDHSKELGLGLNAGAGDVFEGAEPVGSVQLWQRFQVGAQRQNEMGLLLQAGVPTLVSGGVYYRINTLNAGPVKVGHQFEAGGAWLGYSLPVAVPLNDAVWLTTQPSIRGSAFSFVQLPVGISIQLGPRERFDAEVGIHAGGEGMEPYIPGYEFMMYGGLALSHHFGKSTRPFQSAVKKRPGQASMSKLAKSTGELTTYVGEKIQVLDQKLNSHPNVQERGENATVTSTKAFYLECDTVRFRKYRETAEVYIEREQRCYFTQRGRSHPFRLQPGSHLECSNWSGGSTIRCVEVAK